MTTDAAIVGGGPAGLAAAIAARLQGLEVAVFEGARPPIDKGCGEGLMPGSLRTLRALGVDPDPARAGEFRGIRFIERGCGVEGALPAGRGLGIRRTLLHGYLVERAAELGVALFWGVQVRGLGRDGISLDGRTVRCRWVIGADGQNSRVRRWAGLDRGRSRELRIGLRRHYRVERWTDCVEVHWGEGCQAYVTPVGPREVSVALISRDRQLRFESVFRRFPELAARLERGQALTPVRGAACAMRRLHSVARGRVALAGDASGSVDAITGEGLHLAFQQAVALGGALASGDLAPYQAAHDSIMRLPNRMARLLLAMDQYRWFRRRVLRALSSEPGLFARLVAIHAGMLSPAGALGRSGALSLGWQFLTA